MNSLYRSGHSIIHRSPAWLKLLLLAISLVIISIIEKSWLSSSTVLALVLALYFCSGFSAALIARALWQLKMLLVIVWLPQLIFNGFERGTIFSVVVFSGVLLAGLISLTTKTSEIVEVVAAVSRSKSFALLIALSINSIAVVTTSARAIAEAGKARGVKPNPIRNLVTLFVVSLRNADDYAEALSARGI